MDILGAAAAAATRAEAEDEAQGPPVDSPDGLPSEDEDGPPENDDDEDAGVNGEEHEAADDAVDQLEQQAGAMRPAVILQRSWWRQSFQHRLGRSKLTN